MFNISILTLPGSSERKVVGQYGEHIKIKLQSQPEKGRANKELISFLAKKLGLHKQDITLLCGHTSTIKVLSIDADEAILAKLYD